jgi:peptide/nickel transport system substrate-binding protein
MEEPKDDTTPNQPVAEQGEVTPPAEGPENTSPMEQVPSGEDDAPAAPSAESTALPPNDSSAPAENRVVTSDDHINSPVPGPQVVTSEPHEHRSITRWLIPLIILIIVGVGLYLVYHYGQTKNTPVTTPQKDISLLRVGFPEPLPPTLYPNVDDSAFTNDIDSQAFEGLTSISDLNKVGPQLALSWTNPDTSTWVFKLRPNVKFHTGRTMTATDVKASLDAIQNYPLGPEYGSTIKDVSVVDPLNVKITTDGADPILPNELTQLFIYDTTSKTPDSPVNGTGPYTIKPGTDIKNTVDLVAFNGYYGVRPHVRELVFNSFTSAEDSIKAINDGNVDIGGVLSKANADKATNPNYTDLAVATPNVAHLVPNTVNGSPLGKLAVRQALMQGLDANAFLAARHLEGEPAAQIVAPDIPGYDPALTRPKYDVTAAKKALADAGYPNGFSFTFTYYTSAQDLADELKRQMALIGVTVKEDPQSDFNILGNKVENGLTDMYYNSLSTSLADASDFISPVVTNSAFYNNPDISKIFTEASQTLDPTKRLQLLKQTSDTMVADRADFPLYVVGDTYFKVSKNLVVQQVAQSGDIGVRFNQVYGK